MYCTRIVTVNCANVQLRFNKECRFVGVQFRKTTKMCTLCLVPLCHGKRDCFLKWHTKDLPADDINEDADGIDAEDEETGDGNNEEDDEDVDHSFRYEGNKEDDDFRATNVEQV